MIALEASELDPRPVTTGLFIQSLNELIDSYGRRIAALKKQVPEVVLLLLFAVFILNGAVRIHGNTASVDPGSLAIGSLLTWWQKCLLVRELNRSTSL